MQSSHPYILAMQTWHLGTVKYESRKQLWPRTKTSMIEILKLIWYIYIWKKKGMLNQDLIKELQTSQRIASHLENNFVPNIFLGYTIVYISLSLVCLFPKLCFIHNTQEIQIMKYLTILYEILWSLNVPTGRGGLHIILTTGSPQHRKCEHTCSFHACMHPSVHVLRS